MPAAVKSRTTVASKQHFSAFADGRTDARTTANGEEDSKDFLSSLGPSVGPSAGRADDDRDDDCHLQRIRSVPQKTGDAGARWGGSLEKL